METFLPYKISTDKDHQNSTIKIKIAVERYLYLGAYFAHKVRHVKDGHDKDGQPLSQSFVAYL